MRSFKLSSHWRRIASLGAILAGMSLLGLFYTSRTEEYWHSGQAAVWGGLSCGIISFRIFRPRFNLNWMVASATFVLLGLWLSADSSLAHPISKIAYYVVYTGCFAHLALAADRIEVQSERSWLLAGSLVNMIVSLGGALDHFTVNYIGTDRVLTTSLLITGLAVIGYGLSLRPPRQTKPR